MINTKLGSKKSKRIIVLLFGILFLLCLAFGEAAILNHGLEQSHAWSNNGYCFEFNGKEYRFLGDDVLKDLVLTEEQAKIIGQKDRFLVVERLLGMGFEIDEAVRYVYPESEQLLKKLQKIIERKAKPAKVKVVKNSCMLQFLPGTDGTFIDRIKFYQSFYDRAKENAQNIGFKVCVGKYRQQENLKELFSEKGSFSTNFSSSNESRKNNIRVALASFDGLVLDEGEVLSFNKTTGLRNESTGYMPAKIITGGTYTLGFGGGVCQVSTTLYNACLLSGLEILEVNSHSLPVSYVEPSFDAMVNVGSSDLVVRNNTNGKIIITTSSKGDVCKVKIFGLKNLYKITRTSEKTKIIPATDDIVDTDYQKYGIEDMQVGEERRVSYKKDGYYSNGYLNYYDGDGNLVKTKKIRSNKYNATTGVVVRREE